FLPVHLLAARRFVAHLFSRQVVAHEKPVYRDAQRPHPPCAPTSVCCTTIRAPLERLWCGITRQIRKDLVPRLTGQREGVWLLRTALDGRLERGHLDAQQRRLHLRSILNMDDVVGIEPLEGIQFPELWHRVLPFCVSG